MVCDPKGECVLKAPECLTGVTVRRERCWTPAGATPARELIRSTREVVSSVSRYNDGCELADVQST
jgi:hypothetical protein